MPQTQELSCVGFSAVGAVWLRPAQCWRTQTYECIWARAQALCSNGEFSICICPNKVKWANESISKFGWKKKIDFRLTKCAFVVHSTYVSITALRFYLRLHFAHFAFKIPLYKFALHSCISTCTRGIEITLIICYFWVVNGAAAAAMATPGRRPYKYTPQRFRRTMWVCLRVARACVFRYISRYTRTTQTDFIDTINFCCWFFSFLLLTVAFFFLCLNFISSTSQHILQANMIVCDTITICVRPLWP